MAGVRQLLKQAQRMQQEMEVAQAALASKEIEHSAGGGAIVVTVTGSQELKALKIDPEFLKEEEADLVEETLLIALQEALAKAKALHEEEMGKLTQGFNMPGMM